MAISPFHEDGELVVSYLGNPRGGSAIRCVRDYINTEDFDTLHLSSEVSALQIRMCLLSLTITSNAIIIGA